MKQCVQCKKDFEITNADREFYAKIRVPEPTLCPECRMKRRLAFMNDKTLYSRTSSKSGKSIISIYPADAPFPVYDHGEWYGDDWDPLSYGQPIDFSRPFFEQLKEVRDRVPRIGLVADSLCVDSPYVNGVAAVKKCHLIFASMNDEDCYYGYRVNHSKNCVDNLFANTCELCYECVEAYSSYNCLYSQRITTCTDSAFLYDCSGCVDCLFCVGLRNKEYCIFNVQYSKEEYLEKKKSYRFDSYDAIGKMKGEFDRFLLTIPRQFASLKNCENATGDNIQNAKNCHALFDGVRDENVSYGQFIDDTRDSMDVNYEIDQAELHYEVLGSGLNAYRIRFSVMVWPNVSDLDYCDWCVNSTSDCFGCVGLRKKQYCILNKQYTKEEYELFRGRLIDHMKKTGEWGEFFPVTLSPFAYNESTAMMFFPMTKEEVIANGWRWQENMPGSFGKETMQSSDIPDSINDITDAILNEMLACVQCGRNYKITKQEYAFYKQTTIPLPRFCFDCRFMGRMSKRNPARLYHRQCMCDKAGHDHGSRVEASLKAGGHCAIEFETTYAPPEGRASPQRPEVVYCEQCYQKEVV